MASSAKRVSKHRENLRAQGLKSVQIWVYDTTDPGFRARIRQQMLALSGNIEEAELVAWWEDAADFEGWDDGGFTEDDLKR